MVHRCCIPKCGMSVRVSEAKGLSYHKFPNKETIRDQWVQAIIPHLEKPESLKVVSRYTRVCSRHFRKKDYCIDSKKRARLISNAVPSRFPRKSTPLVIPTVLPVTSKLAVSKSQVSSDIVPGTSTNNKTVTSTTVGTSNSTISIQSDNIAIQPKEIDGEQFVDVLGSRELVIESASIQDDLVVLTLADPVSHVEIEGVSVANSDDQSQGLSTVKMEETGGGAKTRKRRKWNRTAFSRPAKGKRKSLSVKQESTNDEDVAECFSDLHPLNDEVESLIEIKHEALHASSSGEELQNSSNENDALSNVTLLLSDHTNQPYHIASVEQELLQSIQAVSLRCVGDHEDADKIHEINNPSADYVHVFPYNNLVPAFLHHHSSEESLFSNESQNNGGGLGDTSLNPLSQSDIATEDDSLRYNLVDLRIDPDMPSSQHPSYSDIDELAHQLNSSLFTDGKIPLFSTDNLSLNNDSSSDLNLADPLLITPDTRTKEEPVAKSSASSTSEKLPKQSIKKGTSLKLKATSSKEIIPPKESEKVSKSPKKDKVTGKFSVERFKSSDKDIEYYTGFNSYRKFEAFFRSMEAYIEKICITDVTYGVKNLPTPPPSDTCSASKAEGTSPKFVEPQNQPKKRPCQGRSMSRIDELFMTIIRLRRKLPEKVLGHMFFISQPTVSRVVRAWTVILSKIIDSYPTESSLSSSSPCKEHSYTCKGLGIPDSFKELFHSELANLIVVTSLNPKKTKLKAPTPECTRKKKTKRNSTTTTKKDCKQVNLSINDEKLLNVVDSDFLANVENPGPIEQLRLFDYI